MYTDETTSATTPGKVILLNGCSSSGKTTLALALQRLLPTPWQLLSLDQFRDGMSGRYRGLNAPPGSPGERGLNIVPKDAIPISRRPAPQAERVTHIQFGDLGRQMLRGMRRAIAAFADAGNNVIVDDILFKREFLQDYLDVLDHVDLFFVGVKCPLAVAIEREQQRSRRFPGTASSHFDQVHQHMIYDIELDTALQPPQPCAQQVIEHITRKAPHAASEMRKLVMPQ